MKLLRQFAVFMLIIGVVLGVFFVVFSIPEILATIIVLGMAGYVAYTLWQLAGMCIND